MISIYVKKRQDINKLISVYIDRVRCLKSIPEVFSDVDDVIMDNASLQASTKASYFFRLDNAFHMEKMK